LFEYPNLPVRAFTVVLSYDESEIIDDLKNKFAVLPSEKSCLVVGLPQISLKLPESIRPAPASLAVVDDDVYEIIPCIPWTGIWLAVRSEKVTSA